MTDPLGVVTAHLDAFNHRDVEGVMATFADDAVFAGGDGLVVGRRALTHLFSDAFSQPLHARLENRRAVVDGDTVACEQVEFLEVEGAGHELFLATFYTVRDGAIVRVKVYREGAG